MIDLTGRVAVVTGGSRGIGAATARLLSAAGAKVAITYRKRQADAEKVVASLKHGGTAIQAEMAREGDAKRVVDETVKALGGLDAYVANAGVWPAAEEPVKSLSTARWRDTLGANLDGVFFGCRAALQALKPGGTIVIVSSTAGQRGEAMHADYAASKGAVISFVKSLAVEAAPAITVNAVAPGWVDTEMASEPYEADGGKGRKRIEAGIPLKRVASADDIAGPILFLCSPLARHITGEILNVNGGSVLCG